jgi:hypothetical protein
MLIATAPADWSSRYRTVAGWSAEHVVGPDRLLDAGELHQLLGELRGIERRKRILALQLRGQQLEEVVEVVGQSDAAAGGGRGGIGGRGDLHGDPFVTPAHTLMSSARRPWNQCSSA